MGWFMGTSGGWMGGWMSMSSNGLVGLVTRWVRGLAIVDLGISGWGTCIGPVTWCKGLTAPDRLGDPTMFARMGPLGEWLSRGDWLSSRRGLVKGLFTIGVFNGLRNSLEPRKGLWKSWDIGSNASEAKSGDVPSATVPAMRKTGLWADSSVLRDRLGLVGEFRDFGKGMGGTIGWAVRLWTGETLMVGLQ